MLNRIIQNKRGELNKIFFATLLILIVSLGIITSQENATDTINNLENTQPLEQNETSAITESESLPGDQQNAEVSSVENIEVANLSGEVISEIPLEEKVELEIALTSEGYLVRGHELEIKARVKNIGTSELINGKLTWELPEKFEIVEQSDKQISLQSGEEKTVTIVLGTTLETGLGENKIVLLVGVEK